MARTKRIEVLSAGGHVALGSLRGLERDSASGISRRCVHGEARVNELELPPTMLHLKARAVPI